MIYESLTPLSSQPLPRYIGGDEHKLLSFTDTSAEANSAAVYLYSSVDGKAIVNLVFSEARVAPAKQLSIPRLELLGVLIELCNSTTLVVRGGYVSVDRLTVCSSVDDNLYAITSVCSEPA